MGQKSNTLTLRAHNERLDSRSLNSKEFWESLEFINTLKRSLEKKGILVTFYNLNMISKTCYLTMNVFFKTQKLLKYKKFVRASLRKKNDYKIINNIFNKLLDNKLLILNLSLINKDIDKKILKSLYLKFKNFKNMLFSRRFNLFIDFLKLTTLFIEKKVDIKVYISILGTIFKILPKRAHSKFFFFLKHLFNILINQKNTTIKGIKFMINGKLKGKLRASSLKILVGKIGTQTISSEIDFSKVHVYTIYGCFGLKIWVNYI